MTLALSAATSASMRARTSSGSGLRRLGQGLKHAHLDIAAELDVGAAPGHVGRDRHRAGHARLGHDPRLLLVLPRVQHVMRDARGFFSISDRSSDFSIDVVPTSDRLATAVRRP